MPATKVMVSFAHRDAALRADLLDRLQPHLACLRDVDIELWWYDRDLHLGDPITTEIVRRVDGCDYGLLLLSPAYFASRYIATYELPRFAGPAADRACIPVDLGGVVLDGTRDLRGVQRHLIFRHRDRCYRRSTDREEYASELATQIRRRILSGR
jgi:TIR domain